MRGIWAALRDAANPCSVLTKSPLILRDLDLLKEVAERTEVTACLSVPTLDEGPWRASEPHTPHPRARLEAVAKLNAAGIPTGVLIAPLLPGINDAPEQVERIIALATEAGATSIGGQTLFLHGAVREIYFDWLRVLPAGPRAALRAALRAARPAARSASAGRSSARRGCAWCTGRGGAGRAPHRGSAAAGQRTRAAPPRRRAEGGAPGIAVLSASLAAHGRGSRSCPPASSRRASSWRRASGSSRSARSTTRSDHAAWTSSIEHIAATPGFAGRDWPPEGGHVARAQPRGPRRPRARLRGPHAASPTPSSRPASDEVIGCVYIYPLRGARRCARRSARGCAPTSPSSTPSSPERSSRWLAERWPFTRVEYAPR